MEQFDIEKDFGLVSRPRKTQGKSDISFLNRDEAEKAIQFHRSFPQYKETPLVNLAGLAKELGLGNIFLKDESYRFGLNAFKVLGGSYAIGRYIAGKLGEDISKFPFERMTSDETRAKAGELTFVTATDGNHGRGVAWTANRLKQKAIVYMPKGSAQERLENIRAEGAEASITEFNYDEAVRIANERAQQPNCVMVQDTAWEGYTDIPTWIMQGYMTMGYEAYSQLGENKPTHIFLQAGVGSMAGAMQGLFANLYGEDRPIVTVVEPNKANCVFRTAQADDGKLHFVTGQMDTIMAGLACGEPCTIGWEVLRDYSDNFVSCPDYAAAKGMRILSSPVGGDTRVVSGESGASTLGCVAEIMTNPALSSIREQLKLDGNSRVLFISTEGDTDRKNYLDIVWDGKYESYRG